MCSRIALQLCVGTKKDALQCFEAANCSVRNQRLVLASLRAEVFGNTVVIVYNPEKLLNTGSLPRTEAFGFWHGLRRNYDLSSGTIRQVRLRVQVDNVDRAVVPGQREVIEVVFDAAGINSVWITVASTGLDDAHPTIASNYQKSRRPAVAARRCHTSAASQTGV